MRTYKMIFHLLGTSFLVSIIISASEAINNTNICTSKRSKGITVMSMVMNGSGR